MKSDRKLKISLIQMLSEQGSQEKNLEKAKLKIEESAKNGAKLICLPELFYGGYYLNGLEMSRVSEKKDGYMVKELCKLAEKLNVYIIGGYAESTELIGKIYNSAIFIDDKGNVIGNSRKVYLWGKEKLRFKNGDKYPVYDTPIGKIGILLCYDAEYPEPSRIMALKGAELILVPSVWSIKAKPRWDIDLSANALFNLIFVAGVNTIGEGICGRSQIYGPDGILRVRASEDMEEIIIYEIDLNEINVVRNQIPYYNDFREDTFPTDIIKKY